MTRPRRPTPDGGPAARASAPRRRCGAILLEILIALSLITGGGMLILGVIGNAYSFQARARRMEFATDLARSKLAELEAGFVGIGDLDHGVIETVGSIELDGGGFSMAEASETWLVEVETIRSSFEGLTEVVVTVSLDAPDSDPGAPLATARQLIRLREVAVDEYEEDPLLRGLPQGGGE